MMEIGVILGTLHWLHVEQMALVEYVHPSLLQAADSLQAAGACNRMVVACTSQGEPCRHQHTNCYNKIAEAEEAEHTNC